MKIKRNYSNSNNTICLQVSKPDKSNSIYSNTIKTEPSSKLN